MRASGYAPLAALLIFLASPAESEIIKLKCVDANGVPVVQYIIDTHRQRIGQVLAGDWGTRPTVTSISDTYVRFIDRSGDAPGHQPVPELPSERGVTALNSAG